MTTKMANRCALIIPEQVRSGKEIKIKVGTPVPKTESSNEAKD
jgi:hypothetical protein